MKSRSLSRVATSGAILASVAIIAAGPVTPQQPPPPLTPRPPASSLAPPDSASKPPDAAGFTRRWLIKRGWTVNPARSIQLFEFKELNKGPAGYDRTQSKSLAFSGPWSTLGTAGTLGTLGTQGALTRKRS